MSSNDYTADDTRIINIVKILAQVKMNTSCACTYFDILYDVEDRRKDVMYTYTFVAESGYR